MSRNRKASGRCLITSEAKVTLEGITRVFSSFSRSFFVLVEKIIRERGNYKEKGSSDWRREFRREGLIVKHARNVDPMHA